MRKIFLLTIAIAALTACTPKAEQTLDPVYDRSDFVEVTEVIPDAILDTLKNEPYPDTYFDFPIE